MSKSTAKQPATETAEPKRSKPKAMIEGSVIRACTCSHAWQDRIYGKAKRVMNATKTMSGIQQQHRCTVCGTMCG